MISPYSSIMRTHLGLLGLVPAVTAQLHSLAVDAGLLYFGTTIDGGYLSDAPYMAIVNDVEEFGQLVPENGQKWQYTEPTQGTFSYTNGDAITNLAAANGQILRCHTLTWYSQLPTWGEYNFPLRRLAMDKTDSVQCQAAALHMLNFKPSSRRISLTSSVTTLGSATLGMSSMKQLATMAAGEAVSSILLWALTISLSRSLLHGLRIQMPSCKWFPFFNNCGN